MVKTEGHYQGVILDAALQEKNRKPQLVLRMAFHSRWFPEHEGWYDTAEEHGGLQPEITAYFILADNKGAPLQFRLEQIRQTFPTYTMDWDHSSQDALMDQPMQAFCIKETYNGQTNMRVQSIGPVSDGAPSSGAGVQKADDNTMRNLKSQWGSTFRAAMPKPTAMPANRPAPTAAPRAAATVPQNAGDAYEDPNMPADDLKFP